MQKEESETSSFGYDQKSTTELFLTLQSKYMYCRCILVDMANHYQMAFHIAYCVPAYSLCVSHWQCLQRSLSQNMLLEMGGTLTHHQLLEQTVRCSQPRFLFILWLQEALQSQRLEANPSIPSASGSEIFAMNNCAIWKQCALTQIDFRRRRLE